ncbi:tRNA (adenosine(37)-N6)-threonylcarbamoyltransferase complex dimerization subunit type 1 TsaB [Paenibacillus lutrae]|uniref:tRNA (Adenosine(37)-N6)-threonylcarbamoyltransferase complex dimerization subunit type 1 TsaB n=1 Tax=Paenibacillus lutrae TaxID=2078573 RepID=A0A7X3K0T0_9BACL|nr:tRNA (adenosine(37)-N6)-threonylcarbamoyltransferase complex dimerization subunit type 1 TsaB [Paenibacillus lutrae]MVP01432.1 tRNA (adenosine(37)-N6)-threonylcarbamoyltransferase complex dimerization subunit type 1 TsaB [Paenibacillus lutrae]
MNSKSLKNGQDNAPAASLDKHADEGGGRSRVDPGLHEIKPAAVLSNQPVIEGSPQAAAGSAVSGYCLAIDTSTSSLALALLEDGVPLDEKSSQVDRNHSIYIMPHVQELLAANGLRPRDLRSVAVGQGPGSYTGVRIAVTLAKTFSWSLNIPMAAVSSLEALALGGRTAALEQEREADIPATLATAASPEIPEAREPAGDTPLHGANGTPAPVRWFIPLMNARRGQAFTGLYAAAGDEPAALLAALLAADATEDKENGARWSCLIPDGIRLMTAYTAQLSEWIAGGSLPPDAGLHTGGGQASFRRPDEILFVGETDMFEDAIAQLSADLVIPVRSLSYNLKATEVGLLALARLARGESDNNFTFVPNYTQLTEAEVKLMAKS